MLRDSNSVEVDLAKSDCAERELLETDVTEGHKG